MRTDNFVDIVTGQPSPYKGLIKCDVLPPSNILYPVIGCHVQGKLIFTVCRTCAEKTAHAACRHTVAQRSIHVTVTDVELTAALLRGYKVLKLYEVWEFKQWKRGGLFRSFNDLYTKVKMEASGWPEANMTNVDKVQM